MYSSKRRKKNVDWRNYPQGVREDSWADEALYERFDSMALASIFNDLHVEDFVLTTRNDAA